MGIANVPGFLQDVLRRAGRDGSAWYVPNSDAGTFETLPDFYKNQLKVAGRDAAKWLDSTGDSGETEGIPYYLMQFLRIAGENALSWVSQLVGPSNLIATTIDSSSIKLDWDDNDSDESSFIIQQSDNGVSGWVSIATVSANIGTYTVTGLDEGTEYFFRVFAKNGADISGFSNVASATTDGGLDIPPDAPTGLTAVAVNTGNKLDWTDNSSNETGFKVQRSPAGAGTWSTIHTTVADIVTYTDTSAVNTVDYDYRIIATNDAGDSAPSNTATVTTDKALNPTWSLLTGIIGSPSPGAMYKVPATGAHWDNVLYMVNGRTATTLQDIFNKFDVVTKTWSTAASPLPVASDSRPAIRLSVSGDKRVVVFGGNDGVNGGSFRFAFEKAERYRLSTNGWTVNDLTFETAYAMVALDQANEHIYVVGGEYYDASVSHKTHTTVRRFNGAANTYTSITSLPVGKAAGAAGFHDGKLFAIGGITDGNTYVKTVYKLSGGTWSLIADAPKKMAWPQYVQVGRYLYIFGFYDGDAATYSKQSYVFDMVNEEWLQLNDHSITVGYGACFYADDGNFYTALGYDGTSVLSSVYKGTP